MIVTLNKLFVQVAMWAELFEVLQGTTGKCIIHAYNIRASLPAVNMFWSQNMARCRFQVLRCHHQCQGLVKSSVAG